MWERKGVSGWVGGGVTVGGTREKEGGREGEKETWVETYISLSIFLVKVTTSDPALSST